MCQTRTSLDKNLVKTDVKTSSTGAYTKECYLKTGISTSGGADIPKIFRQNTSSATKMIKFPNRKTSILRLKNSQFITNWNFKIKAF